MCSKKSTAVRSPSEEMLINSAAISSLVLSKWSRSLAFESVKTVFPGALMKRESFFTAVAERRGSSRANFCGSVKAVLAELT